MALSSLALGFLAWLGAPLQEPEPAPGAPELFGAYRTGVTGLEQPAAVALAPDATMYVVEAYTDRVRIFGVDGAERAGFGEPGSGEGQLLSAQGIALAPGGEVLVADTGNHRVQVFDAEGAFLRSFGTYGAGAADLCEPHGLTARGERIYVADSGNDRVQVFDLTGRHVATIGRPGTGPGELQRPLDVALGADGELYVADSDNQRIARFDAEGRFELVWGEFGPHPGFFGTPSGVDASAGLVYVADRDNHRIQVFDGRGERVYEWGLHAIRPRESEGKLHYPSGIRISPAGDLAVVCESFENRLQLFGRLPSGVQPPAMDPTMRDTAPHFGPDLAEGMGLLAVCEPSIPRVTVFAIDHELDPPEPIQITQLLAYGKKHGQVLRPSEIAIDAGRKRLFVSDPALGRLSSFRIQREEGASLAQDPKLLRFERALDFRRLHALGEGSGPWPIRPAGMEVDGEGRIWISDARSRALVVLSEDFEPLQSFGGESALLGASDLAFSRSGEVVYVVDELAQRVRAFDREGNERFAWGSHGRGEGQFVRPFGVAVGSDGSVYVSDSALDRVQRFDAQGAFAGQIGGERGLGKGQLFKPKGLAVDREGRLFVLDFGNHRGQIFTPDGEFVHTFGARLFTRPALR
jgi:tripartite motif-containing protein 71